jgi:hypothetical protein
MRRQIIGCVLDVSNASGKLFAHLISSHLWVVYKRLNLIVKIPRYILILHQLIAHTSHNSANELKSLENAKVKLEELSKVNYLLNTCIYIYCIYVYRIYSIHANEIDDVLPFIIDNAR